MVRNLIDFKAITFGSLLSFDTRHLKIPLDIRHRIVPPCLIDQRRSARPPVPSLAANRCPRRCFRDLTACLIAALAALAALAFDRETAGVSRSYGSAACVALGLGSEKPFYWFAFVPRR